MSSSSTWFSRKMIWFTSCLISKEQASPVNLIPKEFLASSFSARTLSVEWRPLEAFFKRLANFLVLKSIISLGVGQLIRICLEASLKTSEKESEYSGKTLFKMPLTWVLALEILSTRLLLYCICQVKIEPYYN